MREIVVTSLAVVFVAELALAVAYLAWLAGVL
jgi:hypothetical protein